jgi:hypothetical protein
MLGGGSVNIPGYPPADIDRVGRIQSWKGDVHACLGFNGDGAVHDDDITLGDSA